MRRLYNLQRAEPRDERAAFIDVRLGGPAARLSKREIGDSMLDRPVLE
jgi:hypothetical protein